MTETAQVGATTYVRRPSGLWMDNRTIDKQAEVIERAEREDIRIRVHYGDVETGEDWGDLNDVEGRIGRSLGGRIVAPLLINKSRSMGGSSILTHCIVRVRYSNRREGGELYVHPTYHVGAEAKEGLTEAQYARHFH